MISNLDKSYKNSAKSSHELFTQISQLLTFYICLIILCLYLSLFFSEQFENKLWTDCPIVPRNLELIWPENKATLLHHHSRTGEIRKWALIQSHHRPRLHFTKYPNTGSLTHPDSHGASGGPALAFLASHALGAFEAHRSFLLPAA